MQAPKLLLNKKKWVGKAILLHYNRVPHGLILLKTADAKHSATATSLLPALSLPYLHLALDSFYTTTEYGPGDQCLYRMVPLLSSHFCIKHVKN